MRKAQNARANGLGRGLMSRARRAKKCVVLSRLGVQGEATRDPIEAHLFSEEMYGSTQAVLTHLAQ